MSFECVDFRVKYKNKNSLKEVHDINIKEQTINLAIIDDGICLLFIPVFILFISSRKYNGIKYQHVIF